MHGDHPAWKWLISEPSVALATWLAALVALIGLFFIIRSAVQEWRQGRERLDGLRPGLAAWINGTPSVDGWRSVLVHIQKPLGFAGNDLDFLRDSGWAIELIVIKAPKNAILARSREDDSSLRGPIVGEPTRTISGRKTGRLAELQPFAQVNRAEFVGGHFV